MPRIDHACNAWPAPKGAETPARLTETQVDTQNQVLRILDEVLSLGGRAMEFNVHAPLLGAIPELDSMAVVTLITTLEDRFGISVDDDEISGDVFASVRSLCTFVNDKLAA